MSCYALFSRPILTLYNAVDVKGGCVSVTESIAKNKNTAMLVAGDESCQKYDKSA